MKNNRAVILGMIAVGVTIIVVFVALIALLASRSISVTQPTAAPSLTPQSTQTQAGVSEQDIRATAADAERNLDANRVNWSVENTFHCTLDANFAKDASRLRLDNPPENFAVLRYVAFNLLKRHPSTANLKH
jgi:predicted transposase YbfD/YdcC